MEKSGKNLYQRISFLFLVLTIAFSWGCAAPKAENQADTQVSAFSVEKENGGELTVQFLDVGQGSAALIHQNGKWMLIDGGDRDYSSYVVSYLEKQGVKQLDYVIATHYDADHLNGVVGVLNVFDCGQVLAADYETDTRVYESFCSIVEEKRIPLIYPQIGETYTFADSVFEIVGPVSYDYKDANSNSIGVRLEYGESSFLICGDATEETEQDILDAGIYVDSDVFAANHHGSESSNLPEFLEAVSPEYIVISCGLENSYGHPAKKVMTHLKEQEYPIFRTDLQGVITASSDGENIWFDTEVCTDYRSGREVEAGEVEKDHPEESTTSNYNPKEYVLNTSTKKYHLPDCSSAQDIDPSNYKTSTETKKELKSQGYEPCKRCNPEKQK